MTTWYVALLATALLVFGAALYFGVESYLKTSLERSLSFEARAIASMLVPQIEARGASWVQSEIAEAYAPEISGRFIRVTRQDGAIIYQSGMVRDPHIEPWAVSHPSFTNETGFFRQEQAGGAHNLLIYTEPCTVSSGVRYQVEMGASLAPIRHVLATITRILLFITPCILIIAAVGGQVLMTMPLRPLVALTDQAERIGTNEMGERLPVIASGDEMERLSLSLNRMISRLEEALAHNRRFSADVSHDLRTPLTILRGELEPMLQTSRLEDSDRESVGIALEEIERMATIVESLLTISRLDSGTEGMNKKPMNLSELAAWTVEQMQVLAEEKKILLRSTHSGPVWILADPARIKQILVNLLDNAIKYTPERGEVAVDVHAEPDTAQAVLEVADTGIGIPPESLPHVFDRFYRSDKARARESGGSGLGLAIVKAISKAHNSKVEIESSEGQGTRVRLTIPLCAAPELPAESGFNDQRMLNSPGSFLDAGDHRRAVRNRTTKQKICVD